MRDAKPYWNKPNREAGDPVYLEHFPLAEVKHDSGKWEMFCVDYKPDVHHTGGKFTEFYWNGDLQETFEWVPVTNPREMLEQFVEHWLETEYDWGNAEKSS